MKKGLVVLNKSPGEIKTELKNFQEMGYNNFIIEPFVPHDKSSEKYLSIERVRDGLQVLYSQKGGIDIEENQKEVQKKIISSEEDTREIASFLSLDESIM